MNEKRIDLYLKKACEKQYENTDLENELVLKFVELYTSAKTAQEAHEEANPLNLDKWRKAYLGTLNALKQDGTESLRKSRQLRKMVFELIESKIDNSIPMPKIQPRYKNDLPLVDITENYLKFETDRILTKYINDKSERATYIDGTCWYKVWWNSSDNTYERSGSPKIELKLVDQVTPQPGVSNYKELEYIFEKQQVSATKIYDLYNRLIIPNKENNLLDVVSCYYLNERGIVGHFMWVEDTHHVICNEEDWQIRKLRTCTNCGAVNPLADKCAVCGSKSFDYKNATTEILDRDLYEITNKYDTDDDVNSTQEGENPDTKPYISKIFLPEGTEIPYYHVRQLPFVPRPAISSLNSIYGISEVFILLDTQDAANKLLTKTLDKTLKSGAVVTKPKILKIGDMDDSFKVIDVDTSEQAQMVQVKQILADINQEIILSQMLYDSGRSSSGVTESFQGKRDTTATSGKAKEIASIQTAGRIESLRVMKAAAFAGLYELILKYLLAFSDEPRQFVKTLPDGQQKELRWNKYMFLDKDKYGNIYYRDDFSFSSDPASTLSQNRVQMWQETQDKFIQGALGTPNDPRTLKLFWNIMHSLQYPLAKVALAGITDNEQHLPFEIEQALMQNPDALKMAMSIIEGGTEQRGGARPNSGPDGNGATNPANIERTNERNRAKNRNTPLSPQQSSNLT